MISYRIPQLLGSIHPFIFITISFLLGIGLRATQFMPLFHGFLISVLIGAWLFSEALYPKIILAALIVVSYCAGAYRLASLEHHHASIEQITAGKTADVIGEIEDITWIDNPFYKYRLTVHLSAIKFTSSATGWQPLKETIQLYTRAPLGMVGDTINLRHITFKKSNNPSFNRYMIKEGIATTLFEPKPDSILLNRPIFSYKRWLFNVRSRVHTALRKKISPETFALFASIFLGSKSFYKNDLEKNKEQFNAWGIAHYLARSGLHLVIFIIIWHWILRYIPLHIMHKQYFLMALIALYCLLSWSSISFTRAVMSFFIYKTCFLAKVPTNTLHSLALVCFLIVLHNPAQLLFLDFQLSFGLTFALALFAHIRHSLP